MNVFVANAEESFRNGLRLLGDRRILEAVQAFQTAIEIHEEADASSHSKGRYLSYYGLGLSLSGRNPQEALHCCRRAARLEPLRSEVWRNLGRVAVASGRRHEAYRAFRRALGLSPESRRAQKDLWRMGIRRRPILPFLDRSNPVNIVCGWLSRSSRRGALAASELGAD